jgi:hypothetical protein
MAQVYSAPEEVKVPEFNARDYNQYIKDMEQHKIDLAKWCKENSKCKDAGEIICFPVGDGQAQYMIFQYSKLIWIQEGDCYSLPEAHTRGLRKADVIKKLESQKAFDSLFARNGKKLKTP